MPKTGFKKNPRKGENRNQKANLMIVNIKGFFDTREGRR